MPSGSSTVSVERLRRGAVGDPDGHVVEHSEQLCAARRPGARTPRTSGWRAIASPSAARAPPRRPRAAGRARARPAGRGSRGASRGRPRRSARAATGSLSASATARNIHSHADGSKVGGPPKLSTVVPGLRGHRVTMRGRVGHEDVGPRRCVEALAVERERGAAAGDEVELLVGEVGVLVVGLDDVVADALRGVGVGAEGAQTEMGAHRVPGQRARARGWPRSRRGARRAAGAASVGEAPAQSQHGLGVQLRDAWTR